MIPAAWIRVNQSISHSVIQSIRQSFGQSNKIALARASSQTDVVDDEWWVMMNRGYDFLD